LSVIYVNIKAATEAELMYMCND